MIINGTVIGENIRPFVIAEVAQAHDGSLGNAFSFVDVVFVCCCWWDDCSDSSSP